MTSGTSQDRGPRLPGPQRPGRTGTSVAATVAGVLLVALLILLIAWRQAGGPAPVTSAGGRVTAPVASARTSLEAKALSVLRVVDSTGKPPKGYVGGRVFQNDGRGGTAPLPRRGPAGSSITYHEYDVNPYVAGVDRGPQRLVTGSDGSAFCTSDHYVTWSRLR